MTNITEKIKILSVKLGINISKMGEMYGNTPQAFSQKVKRGTFYPKDLDRLCKKLGIDYEINFILKDGEKI